MRLIEAMKHKIRTFLEIDNMQQNAIYLQNLTDFDTECYKNRVWNWGDKDAIEQLYKQLNSVGGLEFWRATSVMGIVKRHTGLPGMIVRIITDIVIRDLNEIEVEDKRKFEWDEMNKKIVIEDVIEEAVKETLIVGDGAFKININTDISPYPLLEYVSGENVDYEYQYGQIREVIFKTVKNYDHKKYLLEEIYGYGYIRTKLYDGDNEVPLNTIQGLIAEPEILFDKSFCMAVPMIISKSNRFKGRGDSIYHGKHDSFDSLDEAWSQWVDALRKGRSKQYIPENILPRDPFTGELMKSNDFDNTFIALQGSMKEGAQDKIDLIQPNIPHESYLATYITALDLCLQGVLSPSTLGIDTKKLDNADAQREKEKTTLYTRNKVVEALQKTIPQVVNNIFKAYDTLNKKTELQDIEVNVSFGEYANPSFESQVETVGKAKQQGIMSTEAAVEELYGDTKDEDWKKEEVERIKSELGIAEMEEPTVTDDVTLNTNTISTGEGENIESKSAEQNIQNE